jgi:flagellar motor protein MotB
MKPSLSKNRRIEQDPTQMDFLSAIPEPAKPMPPVGPGADGTPPLPLINQPPPIPETPVVPLFDSEPEEEAEEGDPMTDKPHDDVFELDPFFKSENTTPETPEPEAILPDATLPDPTPPEATAEERLLNTIVSETDVTGLQAELENALTQAQSALTARNQARQDLQILKTRFSTLESDLAAAREETATAYALKAQEEARHADSERQWSEKLSHLRGMLDEVEDIRDELNRKRVPRILFSGTLAAGILATAFAYFIGAGQASRQDIAEAPSLPPVTATPLPVAAIKPVLPPPISPPIEPVSWPVMEGSRWHVTQSDKIQMVTFLSGTFTRNMELSSEAKEDLKAIATAIKAKGNRFQVEVEGHTDSSKVIGGKNQTGNNKALGLARAKVAANVLIKSGGLPATSVTTSSAGEANPPYPNTTPENQKKNRTVILKITASAARSL